MNIPHSDGAYGGASLAKMANRQCPVTYTNTLTHPALIVGRNSFYLNWEEQHKNKFNNCENFSGPKMMIT